MFRPQLAIAAFLGTWLGAGSATAHITLIDPAPRTSQQKQGPCGTTGLPRGDTVAVFAPGETITVMWNETVDHRSHYRIAFDLDGDDDLIAPAGDDDLYNSPAVLVDDIADGSGGRYVQDVTLPDVECERCVLQLIQVMYGSGNYFQCADIAIRRGDGPAPDAGTDAGAGVDGGPADDGGSPAPATPDSAIADEPDAFAPDASADGEPSGSAGGRPGGRVVGGCEATGRAPFSSAPVALGAALLLLSGRRRRGRRPPGTGGHSRGHSPGHSPDHSPGGPSSTS